MNTPFEVFTILSSHLDGKRIIPANLRNAFADRLELMSMLWPDEGVAALTASMKHAIVTPRSISYVRNLPIAGTTEFKTNRVMLHWGEKTVTIEGRSTLGTASDGETALIILAASN